QRMGEAPVIFDTVQANRSGDNMLLAVKNLGYLHARVEQKRTVKGKKVWLSYNVTPGERYKVRDIRYHIEDSAVDRVVRERADQSLLRVGMPFDLNVLDQERSRISSRLQNNGYYKFNKDYVRFEADTCVGHGEVDLDVVMPLYRSSTDSEPEPHRRYKIRSVSFSGDAQLFDARRDTMALDSIVYQGVPIYYRSKLPFRPSVFTSNNEIRPGQLYREHDVQRTYSNFGRLGAVMFSNIKMVENDSLPDLLDCFITIHENKPRSLGVELEGTNSSGDLGAAVMFTYQNRNLFRGSELFYLKLRGASEAITGLEGYSDQNYMEVSVETGLTLPNFRIFRFSRLDRGLTKATSEISLLYDSQNRPEFHRRVLTSSLRYRWQSPNGLWSHRVDLIDLNYVFMPWISETFRHDYLENETDRNAILRYNYENLFIMGLGYSFTYNSQRNATSIADYGSNALGIRFNIESSGNLLYGLSNLFGTSRNNNNQYTLFSIAYAQYVKGDFDVSKSFRFDDRNSLALHFGLGVAYPYGNSSILPYEKRYFSGGANSVRGWSVRELGPGRFMGGDGRIDFINQTGDIKLDMNAEYRTFLFWKLNGAVFVDAGNIWTIRNYAEQPGGQFRLKSFWREIAVAYGLGLRLNFDYFILRLDGGMKAIHPAYDDARRHYPIIHPNFKRDFTLHFAVGLPF
ncbi:MAG: BamA/TamA family outer membrane protein, partial [Paraprevotella sp.]|nr:BamA/TamA family outer membrane protein [Paraprevotella sp.]